MSVQPAPSSDDLEVAICRAESVLARLLEWGRAADARLGFILPLSTAMLGVLAALSPSPGSWSMFAGIMSAFAGFFLFLSVGFSALSSFPRTNGPLGSMIYFRGITAKERAQYEQAFRALTNEEYLTDLVRQCHRNAQIAERKFTWIQRSIACLYVASVPWTLGIFELYAGGI